MPHHSGGIFARHGSVGDVLCRCQERGGSELLVYLPARSTFPMHSPTSDEIYVWIQGDFTYIAADGITTPLSGHTYIRLPGNVPHGSRCGTTPCMFYVRYTGPFDSTIHPMPAKTR